ncbi:MAG TPA: hypothetical protein VMZ74_09965 [Ramlibacter sp.]|nr:hypothetical protein [Ramlibacter sp.]
MMSRASARAIKTFNADWHRPAAATLPLHDQQNTEHLKEGARDSLLRPTTGRNSKLGKKAEKPRDPKSGGPSGQKERARHDKRHANK